LIWSTFPLFSFLRQKPINAFLNDLFFLSFSLFYVLCYDTEIFWTVTEWNNNFFYLPQIQGEEEIWTLRNFSRNNKKFFFQKDIIRLMELSSDTKWCEHHDHVENITCISGLIEVWHKDNMYLGTSTIGNGNPYPMNIDSRMRSKRMTTQSHMFFDKLFFSSL